MQKSRFKRLTPTCWQLEPTKAMNVPVVIFGDEAIITDMDDKVAEQAANVAALPGIVRASYALPDAHSGYGFPIGGVAAFDPENGGVISAGGVGFDISCGVRTLLTGLTLEDVAAVKSDLAEALFRKIPAGVGSTGKVSLAATEMDEMLSAGAEWAVDNGMGTREDLERIEENGRMRTAKPAAVSPQAKSRQKDQTGTLGSGNHYLEVQHVTDVYAKAAGIAEAFGLKVGDVVVSIHCGSRGLGHQIATDYLKKMNEAAASFGLRPADRELGCAPIDSKLGQDYFGAMSAGINCALANRQILTHLVRQVFSQLRPMANIRTLYDVSHNTCKIEEHEVDGNRKKLYVHRKGATRAFGPGHPDLPASIRQVGQPVLVGGTMGTASYILAGTAQSMGLAWGSAVHGAGRAMSRSQATKQYDGRDIVTRLGLKGVIIKSPSVRGIAEEAPGAYKDVTAVVDAADSAALACKVARLEPLICVKG